MKTVLYIAVMAGVTYLIRVLPFVLFRREIKSRFFKDFLYYIPYAVLSAMTVPAVFYCTGSLVTALCGFGAALILSFFEMPLIVASLSAAAVAYIAGLIF